MKKYNTPSRVKPALRAILIMAPTNTSSVNTILMLLLMSTVLCYQLNILILLLLRRRTVREKRLINFLLSQNMTKMLTYRRKIRKIRRKRRWWVAPGRTDNWWIRMTSGEAPPEEWNKNFRMSRENFVELVNELRPFITPDPNSPRLGLDPEKRLAVCLYYLKDTAT